MTDRHHENQRLRTLVQRLLDAETGDDPMICHDGGFRYAGDFMSMEADVIQPASILSPEERRALIAHGFIETDGEISTVRVSDAGRAFAFDDGSSR